MHAETLSSTEAHSVDLIALRAWHWSASCDPTRDHEMRHWHRDQCKWITMRMTAHGKGRITTEALAVVELQTEAARKDLHKEMRQICAGDWDKNCQLAREAILARLRRDPRFEDLS